MNEGVQQQTQRVYENMALLPLDLFARVIATRIDAGLLFQRSSRFGYRRWRRSDWLHAFGYFLREPLRPQTGE
jgi:hypothetical protein